MDQYKLEYEKGSGTFSVVFTALSLKSGKYTAIKCMKKKFESVEKVKKLKEIQALNILSSHENIIKMIQALYDQPSGKLALVFELMDMNLYECLKSSKSPLTYQRIKLYMWQVMHAIDFMHRKGIFHRDIKPENILIKDNVAKLADLGSCKGKHSTPPFTDYISTRWYRAPECLMTDGYYNEKMDIWGYGCVLFELITKKPLFPGKDELDQIHKINRILGTPKPDLLEKFRGQASHMELNFEHKRGIGLDKVLPTMCPHDLRDLLHKLLAYDPADRISADQALKHQYFAELGGGEAISSGSKDFRSTFFSKAKDKWEDGDKERQSVKPIRNLSKPKNYGSRNNLEKGQDQIGTLPKIINPSNNFSNIAENRTFYTKKNSTNFNLASFQLNKKKH